MAKKTRKHSTQLKRFDGSAGAKREERGNESEREYARERGDERKTTPRERERE
jgi:hypothetical protein